LAQLAMIGTEKPHAVAESPGVAGQGPADELVLLQ
jgi:hypothetical protein